MAPAFHLYIIDPGCGFGNHEPERRNLGKLITFATCLDRVLRREAFLTGIR